MMYHVIPVYPLILIKRRTHTVIKANSISFVFAHDECFITNHSIATCGPDSSVGVATGYELDGTGIESPWGRDFPHLFRPAMGPTQPPVKWIPGFSRG